jgi:hypothetical protein
LFRDVGVVVAFDHIVVGVAILPPATMQIRHYRERAQVCGWWLLRGWWKRSGRV